MSAHIQMGEITPWGRADYKSEIAEGITIYGTPSHGGIHLSPERLEKVDEAFRKFAEKWSGHEEWFEEDCAALAVIVTFPESFPDVTSEQIAKYTAMLWTWVEESGVVIGEAKWKEEK